MLQGPSIIHFVEEIIKKGKITSAFAHVDVLAGKSSRNWSQKHFFRYGFNLEYSVFIGLKLSDTEITLISGQHRVKINTW